MKRLMTSLTAIALGSAICVSAWAGPAGKPGPQKKTITGVIDKLDLKGRTVTVRLTVSGQQNPTQQVSVRQTPVRQTPIQQSPVRQTPVQQTPVQQTPVQQTPVQQIQQVQQSPVQQSQTVSAVEQRDKAPAAPMTFLVDTNTKVTVIGKGRIAVQQEVNGFSQLRAGQLVRVVYLESGQTQKQKAAEAPVTAQPPAPQPASSAAPPQGPVMVLQNKVLHLALQIEVLAQPGIQQQQN